MCRLFTVAKRFTIGRRAPSIHGRPLPVICEYLCVFVCLIGFGLVAFVFTCSSRVADNMYVCVQVILFSGLFSGQKSCS